MSFDLTKLRRLREVAGLDEVGREATYRVTLDMFAAHPEVLGIMWMYKVPIHDWHDDTVRLGDDNNAPLEQDLTLPRVILPVDLTHGLAIPSYIITFPAGDRGSIVRLDSIQHKLPAIVTHVHEIFVNLRELKVALGPAWGESVRVMVYRDGTKLDVQVTEQQGRNLHWHDDVEPDHLMKRFEPED